MFPTNNTNVVTSDLARVLVKEPTWDKPKEAILYCIHHDDDNNPYATCYMLGGKFWLVTQLGFVQPMCALTNNNDTKEKKVLME